MKIFHHGGHREHREERKRDGNTEVTEVRTQRAQRRKKERKKERSKVRANTPGGDNPRKFDRSRRKHFRVEVFVFD